MTGYEEAIEHLRTVTDRKYRLSKAPELCADCGAVLTGQADCPLCGVPCTP
jgi:hydrogenase maturation factor